MQLTEVRTRFAPSPTGYMHIGNLRTALYAYLIAKKDNGKFLLRIEDTDQNRFIDGSIDLIYKTLKETGLTYDEGPDVGGPYGPYIQSKRQAIYHEYAIKLIEKKHAYRCFCDKERLDFIRLHAEEQGIPYRYDGKCRHLSADAINANLNVGNMYVIRQHIPASGTTTFHDEVYGSISVPNSTLDDQVLLKSDGLPTYNFANVVDDHLMNISHVVRGTEYLSSTPKYQLLYEAFGWIPPLNVHVPPVMRSATQKLSKRDGDASYEDFAKQGYLPEALINYIALLGWHPGTERELYSLTELTEVFDIAHIHHSPAIFDIMKLNWMNAEYIRAMPQDRFYEIAGPYVRHAVKGNFNLSKIANLLQGRIEKLTDILVQVDFFDNLPNYSIELFKNKKMKTDMISSLNSLKAMLPVLINISSWDFSTLHKELFELIARLSIKNGLLLFPLRVAVSGKEFTPGGGIELIDILGKTETIQRISMAIEKLGYGIKIPISTQLN
jgi:glutamyl-tRNA synthetase